MPTDLTLSVIVFAPLAGGLVILGMPLRTDLERFRVRTMALFATVVSFVVAVFDLLGQVGNVGQGSIPDPVIDAPWFRGYFFQLDYHLGTDGLNLLLLFAATAVFMALVLASWRQRDHYRTHFFLLLVCEVGVLGALATQDLGLFIIFFGAPALPLALLVALHGGGRARQAARRLLLLQSLSLAALIAGTLLLLLRTGDTSLNFTTLTTVKDLSGGPGLVVATLFLVAFLLRMGAFPFHRWFLEGIAEAPTPVGMLLAVSSLPIGAYGLVRVLLAMEPDGALALLTPILVLALLSLFWGALGARAATELRRVGAHSLLAVTGLVLLGAALVSETSISGSLYMVFAYLFAAPLLLLVLGAICERTQLLSLGPLRGAAFQSHRLLLFFTLAAATLTGVPLLVGFPALFEIVASGLATRRLFTAFAVLGLLVLTSAWWRLGHRVFSAGPEGSEPPALSDAQGSELYSGWVLGAAVILFGVFAGYFLPYTIQGTSLVSARIATVAPATHPKAK